MNTCFKPLDSEILMWFEISAGAYLLSTVKQDQNNVIMQFCVLYFVLFATKTHTIKMLTLIFRNNTEIPLSLDTLLSLVLGVIDIQDDIIHVVAAASAFA